MIVMFLIFLSLAREMARNYNVTISRFRGSRLARFSDQGDNGLISGKSIRKEGASGGRAGEERAGLEGKHWSNWEKA